VVYVDNVSISDYHICFTSDDGFDDFAYFFLVVLIVGVCIDNNIGAHLERFKDAFAKSAGETQVSPVLDYLCSGLFCKLVAFVC
jgi:hypothetical protein